MMRSGDGKSAAGGLRRRAGSATYAANHYSLSHLGYDLYVLVDKSQYSARTLQLAGRQLLWMAVILLFSGVLLLRFLHPLLSP